MTDEPERPDVHLVNRFFARAQLTDGSWVPVTHWFNLHGDCEPKDATACVCGSDEAGWYSVDLVQFKTATVH